MPPLTPRHRSRTALRRSAAVPTLAAVRQGLETGTLPAIIVAYHDDAYPFGVRTSLVANCSITLTKNGGWIIAEEDEAGEDVALALLADCGRTFAELDIAIQHVIVRAMAELLRDKGQLVPLALETVLAAPADG